MKVVSYNCYGVVNGIDQAPHWDRRLQGIPKVIDNIIAGHDPDIFCFQEVNKFNLNKVSEAMKINGFDSLSLFPMTNKMGFQYNLVYFKSERVKLLSEKCVAHADEEYQSPENQVIKYGMSDYRTSILGLFEKGGEKFIVGNTHTDYISPEGKIRGTIKTINEIDKMAGDLKIPKVLVGDFNMVVHMSEMYVILQNAPKNWETLSTPEDMSEKYQSWHGYGSKEEVNPDFAMIDSLTTNARRKLLDSEHFVEVDDEMIFPSDHHPILVEF